MEMEMEMEIPTILLALTSIIAILVTYRWWTEQQRGIYIKELYTYPIKSCAGIRINTAEITRLGFEYDRRWLFVYRKSGNFITARQFPKLATIKPTLDIKQQTLTIAAPNIKSVTIPIIPPNNSPQMKATVFDQVMDVTMYDNPDITTFIDQYLGVKDIVLVTVLNGNPDSHERSLNPRFNWTDPSKHIQIAFADRFPFLLTNHKSLIALNKLCKNRQTPMSAFRPNIVISGAPLEAWDEDSWRSIRMGGLMFDIARPCDRCSMPRVHPETGVFDEHQEPTATLLEYRAKLPNEPESVFFGHLITQREIGGRLTVGDQLEVVSKKLLFQEERQTEHNE